MTLPQASCFSRVFSAFDIEVEPGVTIHGVHGGTGPALLLLHGFPQTHVLWHIVAPQLASRYHVVAMDLRGYGASSKPDGGDSHEGYAKTAMARDTNAVMQKLGFQTYFVCGHDRGGRVAHKLCVDHPGAVRKAIFLDICPTLAMYEKTGFFFAKAYYHWFFLIQKAPFPERVISSDATLFADLHLDDTKVLDPEAFKAYVKALGDYDTVHAMCEDYRAGASIDMEESRQDIAAGRHIRCPLRLYWAKHGVIEQCYDAIGEWKAVHATGDVDGHVVDCGHNIPEELPNELVKYIQEFFS